MPIYKSREEFQNAREGSDKLEFAKRDGMYYTGKDYDRLMQQEQDAKTAEENRGAGSMSRRAKALASDVAETAVNDMAGKRSGVSTRMTDRENRLAEEGKEARARLSASKVQRIEPKKKGGVIKMAKGGSVSKRADGCAQRGKTRGKMV